MDTARGISTQSKQRIRMRTLMVRNQEVRGQTANLVSIVSAVVLRSFRPSHSPFRSPFLCSPSGRGVRAHCSAASTLTNQFSAQCTHIHTHTPLDHSRVFIIISCRLQAEVGEEGTYGRIPIGRRNSLCAPTLPPHMSYRNFYLAYTR